MRLLSICLVAWITIFLMADRCICQEIDFDETSYDKVKGERTAEGLRFAIAEDRQVVRNGQFIEPEGLDKYLGRKFDKLIEVVSKISTAVSAMGERISKLESSVNQLTKAVKPVQLKSSEEVSQ